MNLPIPFLAILFLLVGPGVSMPRASLVAPAVEAAWMMPESFPAGLSLAPMDSENAAGIAIAQPEPAPSRFCETLERSRAAAELAPDLFAVWLHLRIGRERLALLSPPAPPKEPIRLPTSAESCLRRAAALIADHKRPEAIPLLLRAHQLKPRDFSLARKISGLLQSPESMAEAQAFAEQLVVGFKKNAEAWQILGAVLRQRGRDEEALAPLRRARELNPKSAASWFAEGSTYVALQRWEEAALKLVQAVRLDPKNELYWRSLTDAYRTSRDFYAGEMKLRQLIEAFPTSAPAWYNLGCVQVAGGLRLEGLKSWQKALELRPRYADAWNQIGVLRLANGDRKGALEAIQRALKAAPKHAEAANNRGWLFLSENKLDPAIADFQTALKSDPAFARAMVNLIRALAKKGDLARANEVCDRLSQLNAAAGAKLRAEITP